jgi:catechol 2,3-dioxygenase-like lactoylglutathione lyase family enzyme
MDMKLELIILPVADVNRAKEFYERCGFRLDVDFHPNDDFRVVQLTPPGSECSITVGTGLTPSAPGCVKGLHLVVTDIVAARAELVGRGIDVSEPFHMGPEGQTPGLDPQRQSYGSFASFEDPDGNSWLLQEVAVRNPEREW